MGAPARLDIASHIEAPVGARVGTDIADPRSSGGACVLSHRLAQRKQQHHPSHPGHICRVKCGARGICRRQKVHNAVAWLEARCCARDTRAVQHIASSRQCWHCLRPSMTIEQIAQHIILQMPRCLIVLTVDALWGVRRSVTQSELPSLQH